MLGLAFFLLTSACGGDGIGPELDPIVLEGDGFTLVSEGQVTEAQATTLLDALENNAPRIMDHLQVADMPHILVRVWHGNDSDEWNATMSSSLGTVYPGATGYIWGQGEMRLLLNPNSPTEVVHEYAHLVSMQVNPSIPNNPRWLLATCVAKIVVKGCSTSNMQTKRRQANGIPRERVAQ